MAKTTKKKNKISVFDVVNLIAMILVGLIMLMPILNLAAKAFSSEGNVIAGKVLFWPLGLQTGTIKYVLTTPEFGTSFLVTVTVTITGTIGAMLLTVMAAYPLSKPQRRHGAKLHLVPHAAPDEHHFRTHFLRHVLIV